MAFPLRTRCISSVTALLLVLLCAIHLPSTVQSAPVIPGLGGHHPLDEQQTGLVLMGELRCASCHEGLPGEHLKTAPTLEGVGSRLEPAFIERFITNPSGIHHGTTMPDTLGELTPRERHDTVRALTAFLLSRESRVPPAPAGDSTHPSVGDKLFHEIGCIACHAPRSLKSEPTDAELVSLNHLPGKYQPGALAEFLQRPLAVRPSGRMPDMKLSKEEATALADFLQGVSKSAAGDKPAWVTDDLIKQGAKAFERHDCTACHQLSGISDHPTSATAPARDSLRLDKGCLSDVPGSAPNFHLSRSQQRAIRAALSEPAEVLTPADHIDTTLTRLNCISCHARDEYGGLREGIDQFFHSTEEALGNEARIPPPLTLVGAKLRPEWLHKVLHEGAEVRPYMTTRMPLFGAEAVKGLTEWLGQVDQITPEVALPPPDRESKPMMKNGAHLLLGDKGLNCIACHNYNGKESPGMKGLDLMTSYQRLQPTWFYHYMVNPHQYRPGIIMPSYWPGGTALQTEILEGDTLQQLRALWYNFSLGRSARDPSGLREEPTVLTVGDQARVYRGRSTVAGYRGIAVGLPGGWNYAFNAEYGSLGALWQGAFVDVNWRGQGSGNFKPAARPLTLSQDMDLLTGETAPEPWPAHPRTSKEHPVNPDPLYAPEHGYRFLGYVLDDGRAPTFRYQCGEVLVADHVRVVAHKTGQQLLRTLTFTSDSAQTIWFRPLSGNITDTEDGHYQVPGLTLKTGAAEHQLRDTADGRELLIRIPVKAGTTTYRLDYVLRD